MGKGSKRRPCLVSYEQYSKNWDRIFGNDTKKRTKKEQRSGHGK